MCNKSPRIPPLTHHPIDPAASIRLAESHLCLRMKAPMVENFLVGLILYDASRRRFAYDCVFSRSLSNDLAMALSASS